MNFNNPYENKGRFWLKGNLHTHTDISSCGRIPPYEVLKLYEKMGYDFLSLTDHRVISNPGEYGTKLILLPGIEIDFNGGRHMCVINSSGGRIIYSPKYGQQRMITENAKRGGLVVLNHPDWELKEHYPIGKLFALTNYKGIEIYNSVIERLYGSPLSTAKWDRLLAGGKKVLGFANQDSHLPGDHKDCCNVVRVRNRTPEDIFNSLKDGNFYCYYGVEILGIGRSGDTVSVETRNARLIRFIGLGGRVLKKESARKARIKFTGHPYYGYIRIECLGEGEQISWSQPFFR
jgi:hypothetical protein